MNLLVSYNWLKEFVAVKQSPEKVAELLSVHALSTERLHHLARQWEKMVIGKVVKTEKHPNADKLTVNSVDIGAQTVQIICGAPNVRLGMLAAVALPGAKVRWHGTGELVALEAAKIRGVESFGMMCSGNEIGLEKYPDAAKGIIDLSWINAKPGTALAKALDMDDVLMDVEVTSNRPDAMSVVGVAREVAAVTAAKLQFPITNFQFPKSATTFPLSVDVRAKKLCTRFAAVVIEGIKVGPSPWWMQKRLIMAGLRPINNIVDITNYVMLEQGKPLHAFDYAKVGQSKIVIRSAVKGESLKALDGKTYALDESMLVVADAKRPLGIAGVMGGEETGVTNTTKTIVFESAVFDAVSIRRTARALNLHSEASNLFEKGLSDESVLPALSRAVELTLEIAGGQVASKVVDTESRNHGITKITLKSQTIERMLGIALPVKDVERYLVSLGFGVKGQMSGVKCWHVNVPWWRHNDITIEEDLVEEIARLYGYHRLPSKLPDGPLAAQPEEERREIVWEKRVKDTLRGAGYTEVMSYSFVPRSWLQEAGEDGPHVIAVANPLTDDLAVMRTSLVPSLLQVIAENQVRRETLHCFELAKVYRWHEGKPQERLRLAVAVVQKMGGEQAALREAKGIAAHVLEYLGVPASKVRMTKPSQSTTEWRDPTRSVCIEVDGVIRGYVGIVRDNLARTFGVDRVVACATFKFEELCALASTVRPYTPLPKYPPVTRDLAFIVPKDVSYADIDASIRKQALVASVKLFDLFEGEKLGAGKKSLAFHVAYQSAEKTLTTAEVDAVQAVMVKELEKKFGAQFRNF